MKTKLEDSVLEAVSGGVTYLPDYPGATTGTCGIGDDLKYRYSSYDKYDACIRAHYRDKQWTSIAERENYLIKCLLDEKVITAIQ